MLAKLQSNLTEKCGKAVDKFFGAAEKADKNNRINIAVICIACVILFALSFFMNSMTHLSLDDYAYHFIFIEDADSAEVINTGDRVESVSDIITSMKAHYNTVNGRIVLHFIVQLMLLWGKPVFNVFNSVFMVLLVALMYLHCKGKNKRQSAPLFLMIAFAVWSFVPSASLTVFWLDGSINYLWGSVFRLIALLPYRYYYDSGKLPCQALLFVPIQLMCAVAGSANENMSAAFIGVAFLFVILYRIKGHKIPVWSVTGIVVAVAGYLFMMLAPAVSIRLEMNYQATLLKYIVIVLSNVVIRLVPFLGAALILAYILYALKAKEKPCFVLPGIYMLGAFAGALIMLASTFFPERAWFGIVMMAIISVGMLVYQLIQRDYPLVRNLVLVGVLGWAMWCGVSYARGAYDAVLVDKKFDKREAYIIEQVELGNYDLTLRAISTDEKRSPHYDVADIGDNPQNYRNRYMAKYYGLNSIIEGENDEY
ncbi:MAG: hypothetical protein IIW48_04195 [Clostridia bacterium]|nr:hypothetical protein [Clostridia bacterium]